MPDQADVRRLALSLPQAVEQPHFDRTSFRVRGRIFVTMRGTELSANLALPPELAVEVLDTHPEAVTAIVWGAVKGWVAVDLQAAAPGILEELVQAAWSRAAPKALQRKTEAR